MRPEAYMVEGGWFEGGGGKWGMYGVEAGRRRWEVVGCEGWRVTVEVWDGGRWR